MIFQLSAPNFDPLQVYPGLQIYPIPHLSLGGGALTVIQVDTLAEDHVLQLSGWASLIWVSVSQDNIEKTLKLMDTTITRKVLNRIIKIYF